MQPLINKLTASRRRMAMGFESNRIYPIDYLQKSREMLEIQAEDRRVKLSESESGQTSFGKERE